MYVSMLVSGFLFHVAVTVAALSSEVLQRRRSAATPNIRRADTVRMATREEPHKESVSIMRGTIA